MSDSCEDLSCCVLPVIMAYMAGALLRQIFVYIRSRVSTWPPYTLLVFGLSCALTALLESNALESDRLRMYLACMTNMKATTLMHVTLPVLAFQPAFATEMQGFKMSLNQVLLLAVTGYLLMTFLCGVIVNKIYDWELENSLIFAAVICFTDPLAVAEVVKVSGVSPNLAALLHGESLISGAMATMCYRLFALLSRQRHERVNLQPTSDISFDEKHVQEMTSLIVELLFAPFLGLFMAVITVAWIGRVFNDTTLEITIVLSFVNIAYLIAESTAMPGMVAVVVMGLYLSSSRSSISHAVEYAMHKFISVLTDVYNSVVFFFVGAKLVVRVFKYGFDWITLGTDVLLYLVLMLLRGLAVFFLSPILRRMGYGMSWDHSLTVWLGALNGSHNIIIGMLAVEGYRRHTLDKEKNHDFQFFHSLMVVIVLKQLINTSITRGLLKTFGLRSMPMFKIFGLLNAMRVLKDVRFKTLNALKSDRFMADADFDIVESDTVLDDMFQRFNKIYLDDKSRVSRSKVAPAPGRWSLTSVERMRDERDESILILLKAQKKCYWRHFDRGLMSKEALHQLLELADTAADHRGRYLDVNKVMQASKVTPVMRLLKRQFRLKLKQMQHERYNQKLSGWQYLQDILPVVALNVWHVIDLLLIFLAIAVEFVRDESYTPVWKEIYRNILLYNIIVVGLYSMITLGEMLVMRLRFFKIVWYDISLLVVIVGLLDVLVMHLVPKQEHATPAGGGGQVYIRIVFICSRLVRRLGQIELSQFLLREVFRLVENRISSRISVGFDICCAYVSGQVEVGRQIDHLFNDPDVADEIKRHCNKSKLQIIRTLGILSLEHRTISLNVKTRQALRIVLNSQHDAIKQLREEGVLIETDAALLIKAVEGKMKRLQTMPPMVEDNAEDNIIKNICWVQGDPALYHFLKEEMTLMTLKAGASLVEQGQENYDIFILRSGVIRLERQEGGYQWPVIDYMTSGNISGEINFLTKTPRHKTVRCETPVTVILLDEDMMEEALNRKWNPNLPPLIYRMWLAVAKRVAIKVYMEDIAFQGISKERLKMRLTNAYLVDDSDGLFIDITPDFGDVFLIHGHGMDTFTRHHFKGPCLIPCSTFQLQLMPEKYLYTLVLMVPEHPVDDVVCEINPCRRPSGLDGSALALSSSFDGLGQKDLDLHNYFPLVDIRNKPKKITSKMPSGDDYDDDDDDEDLIDDDDDDDDDEEEADDKILFQTNIQTPERDSQDLDVVDMHMDERESGLDSGMDSSVYDSGKTTKTKRIFSVSAAKKALKAAKAQNKEAFELRDEFEDDKSRQKETQENA